MALLSNRPGYIVNRVGREKLEKLPTSHLRKYAEKQHIPTDTDKTTMIEALLSAQKAENSGSGHRADVASNDGHPILDQRPQGPVRQSTQLPPTRPLNPIAEQLSSPPWFGQPDPSLLPPPQTQAQQMPTTQPPTAQGGPSEVRPPSPKRGVPLRRDFVGGIAPPEARRHAPRVKRPRKRYGMEAVYADLAHAKSLLDEPVHGTTADGDESYIISKYPYPPANPEDPLWVKNSLQELEDERLDLSRRYKGLYMSVAQTLATADLAEHRLKMEMWSLQELLEAIKMRSDPEFIDSLVKIIRSIIPRGDLEISGVHDILLQLVRARESSQPRPAKRKSPEAFDEDQQDQQEQEEQEEHHEQPQPQAQPVVNTQLPRNTGRIPALQAFNLSPASSRGDAVDDLYQSLQELQEAGTVANTDADSSGSTVRPQTPQNHGGSRRGSKRVSFNAPPSPSDVVAPLLSARGKHGQASGPFPNPPRTPVGRRRSSYRKSPGPKRWNESSSESEGSPPPPPPPPPSQQPRKVPPITPRHQTFEVSYSDPITIPRTRPDILPSTPLDRTLEVSYSEPVGYGRHSSPADTQLDGQLPCTPVDQIFHGRDPSPYDDPHTSPVVEPKKKKSLPFTPVRRRSVRGDLSLTGHNGPSPTPGRASAGENEGEGSIPAIDDDDDPFAISEELMDELIDEEEDLAMPDHDDITQYSAAIYGEDYDSAEDVAEEEQDLPEVRVRHIRRLPAHPFDFTNEYSPNPNAAPLPDYPPPHSYGIRMSQWGRNVPTSSPRFRPSHPWVWNNLEDISVESSASGALPHARMGRARSVDSPAYESDVFYEDGRHASGSVRETHGYPDSTFVSLF
ncbi:unnamed protein product [Somion occarium]|uniref:Uncharacterized protein n=1 Tax=Somion occarium TaxID=3059160 RepID=A0ABP1D471_9APHY